MTNINKSTGWPSMPLEALSEDAVWAGFTAIAEQVQGLIKRGLIASDASRIEPRQQAVKAVLPARSQPGQSIRTTFKGNSPSEREPCRIALFDRGHRLSGHPGEGLNFSC
jgi:hypothetical protein